MAIKTKTGTCFTYRGLKFYAENGFVSLHDEATGEYFVLTRKEFLLRAQALSEEADKLRKLAAENPAQAAWYSEDRVDLIQAVENMIACTREAKEQGDRTDPEVDAWFRRHRPTKRSRIAIPGSNFTVNTPGPMPLGKDTGKRAPADFTMESQQSAPKKLLLPGDF